MTPRTKRDWLRELVAGKNRWNRPLSEEEEALGFQGWHQRGYLPHCDYPGLVQLVTFRLNDSLPNSRRSEWEHLLAIENDREKRKKLEEYLDLGRGNCCVRDKRIALTVEKALLHFHRIRYELLAWCIMPNHVHVLVEVWQVPVSKLVQSWKRYSATQAAKIVSERRTPIRRAFWERDYWDTYMRDEKQTMTAVKYIEANPVKAQLCTEASKWQFSSARFRDKLQRLNLPLPR